MRFLIAALVLLAFGGCSSKSTAENLFKVKEGMTPNQVKELLGEPIKKSKVILRYVYKIDGRPVSIEFNDDYMVSVIQLGDNTDEVEKMFGYNEESHNDNNSPNKAQY